MSPPTKFALITGACSGIGLCVTRHLLAKTDTTWHVVLVDIRETAWESIKDSFDTGRTTFVKADVSSWEDNAKMFKIAYHGNQHIRIGRGEEGGPEAAELDSGYPRKIDFFFANAGTGDKELISQLFSLDNEPLKPDLSCFDVQLTGVLYGLKLFIHYTRKARRDIFKEEGDASSSSFQPDMVITSSCTAQYLFPVAPHYAAGKAALLSLTRSVGVRLLPVDGIALNCLMPGYVATNLTPPGLNEAWPKHWITPVETMARAVDELIDAEGRVAQDGKSDGQDGSRKFAQSVECVIDKLFYRKPVEYVDESQEFLINESVKPDGLWVKYVNKAMEEAGGIGVSR